MCYNSEIFERGASSSPMSFLKEIADVQNLDALG